MLARRTFLQFSALAAMASPLAVAAKLASDTASVEANHVLVDPVLTHSEAFAAAWAKESHISRGALLTEWARLQLALGDRGRISGLSRASDLPLVMQLVARQGARLVYRSEHDARGGTWEHDISLMGETWSQRLGERLSNQNVGVNCRALLAHDLRCAGIPPFSEPVEFMLAWSVVYGAA